MGHANADTDCGTMIVLRMVAARRWLVAAGDLERAVMFAGETVGNSPADVQLAKPLLDWRKCFASP